jgi:CAAX prenyl protease-like protein
MAAFLLLTGAESYATTPGGLPDPTWYPALYAAKVAAVTALLVAFRSTWRDLLPRPRWPVLAAGAALGLVVAALWVALDPITPAVPFLGGSRSAFNPSAVPGAGRYAFLAARFFGLVLVVPPMEELFWRSFLMRWLIDPDFGKVPVGRVTLPAALITSALFAAAHPEWLAALVTGLLWAALLWRTRSLAACLVSHAVANLALGVYVVSSGTWKFL